MLFSEEEAPLLKTWIVKRIENTSDADSDVLAEYIIALLKHDGPPDAVRKLCAQEIPDFLTEDPKIFLDDVFQAIAYKSFLPGAPPAPPLKAAEPPQEPDRPPQNNSRKRGFHDRDDKDVVDGRDTAHAGGRSIKQARRNGRGRDDMRGQRQQPHGMSSRSGMPNFDPNNPMELFMQLQAMGMPYPGMPKMPQNFNGRDQPRRRGRCRDFDTKGYCSRGTTCMYDHGNDSVFLPLMPQMGPNDEYDPSDPNMFPMPHALNAMNPNPFNPEPERSRKGRKGRNSKKGGGRAPFSADGPVHDRSKSTIVVENIPEENFTEEAVREFFSQFGNIKEVSMQPYKHLAIVKYEKWGSANAAYRSPKVIFDNRFVKVFWYKEDADIPPSSAHAKNGSFSHDQGDQVMTEDAEPELDMEEFQQRQEEAQKQHQEREAKRAELEQKRSELEKQQQELLAKHREENEKLQAKLSSRDGTPSTGADLLRAKLAALEQEAKILGIDPNAAEEEYTSWAPRGGYRGRGAPRGRGYAPRGRGSLRGRGGGMHAAYAQYSIDNRPRKLAIKGVDFTSSEKDEMLRHFLLNLGEFESVETGPTVTHVAFQDRKTAEKFYYSLNNRELPGVDGKLELSWVATPLPPVKPSVGVAAPENAAVSASEDAPRQMERSSPEPERQEARVVNMDYEVADEDVW